MILDSEELSLNYRPFYNIPKTVSDVLRDVCNVSDKIHKFDDIVKRLEDEMLKIVAFKLELPLTVLFINDGMHISGYFYPCFHYIARNDGGADWLYVGNQDSLQLVSSPSSAITNYPKDVLTAELKQKIIKQAEYQFSAMSLLANESLIKLINKDPEGYGTILCKL
ncbi:hypothetical protein OROMI_004027 [Orobanche minor]